METTTQTMLHLIDFAIAKGLVEAIDRAYALNRLLEIMQMDAPEDGEFSPLRRSRDGDCLSRRAVRRRLCARHHRRQRGAPRPVLREADGRDYAAARGGARQVSRAVQGGRAGRGHGRLLSTVPRVRLHSRRRHREKRALFRGPRRASWKSPSTSPSRKKIRATSPPPRHEANGLPQVHALRGKSRLRGTARISRAPEPPIIPLSLEAESWYCNTPPISTTTSTASCSTPTRADAHQPRHL